MTTQQTVALVTGANKGIGLHAARQLAERGVHVLVGSRDPDRGRAAVDVLVAEGLPAELLVLDVTDPASVDAALQQVARGPGQLDVLVNNAAIVSGGEPTSRVAMDELRRTFETNVFGVATVTNAALPLLRRSPSPRIVNVSSGLGSLTLVGDPAFAFSHVNSAAYQASKAALNALTVLYANELRGEGFLVNAVSPGYRATDLTGGPTPGAGDPAEGAVVVVRMATLDDDGPTGGFFSDTGEVYPW